MVLGPALRDIECRVFEHRGEDALDGAVIRDIQRLHCGPYGAVLAPPLLLRRTLQHLHVVALDHDALLDLRELRLAARRLALVGRRSGAVSHGRVRGAAAAFWAARWRRFGLFVSPLALVLGCVAAASGFLLRHRQHAQGLAATNPSKPEPDRRV